MRKCLADQTPAKDGDSRFGLLEIVFSQATSSGRGYGEARLGGRGGLLNTMERSDGKSNACIYLVSSIAWRDGFSPVSAKCIDIGQLSPRPPAAMIRSPLLFFFSPFPSLATFTSHFQPADNIPQTGNPSLSHIYGQRGQPSPTPVPCTERRDCVVRHLERRLVARALQMEMSL